MLKEKIINDKRLVKRDVEVLLYMAENQPTEREAAKVFGVSQTMIRYRLKRVRERIKRLYKL